MKEMPRPSHTRARITDLNTDTMGVKYDIINNYFTSMKLPPIIYQTRGIYFHYFLFSIFLLFPPYHVSCLYTSSMDANIAKAEMK